MNGIVQYDAATQEDYRVYDNQNGLLSNGIFSIKFDAAGQPWVGAYGGGLSRHDGQQWINYNIPHGLRDAFVYDVEMQGDVKWIATWSGANRIRGDPDAPENWESFTTESTDGGLIDDWVYAIELGKDGRTWFGTESGVSMFDGARWKNWNHATGLGASLDRVKKDNAGAVGKFKGSHHANQPRAIPGADAGDYRPNYVISMLLDKKNRLWVGLWGAGLAMLDPKTGQIRNFTVQDGLPGNYVLALEEGPGGDLWIGTNNGMSRFDGETFINFSTLNGLPGKFISSLAFGAGNYLWVGGRGGFGRLQIAPNTHRLINR